MNDDHYNLVGSTLKGAKDKYDIKKVAGSGEMSIVYLAHRAKDGECVAIKVLHPELLISPDTSKTILNLFERGAEAAKRLKHLNIVATEDSGIDGYFAFTAMEWLQGHPLDEELYKGPLSINRTLAILDQMSGALEHAHNRKIIHLDLKPRNVFVLEGPTRQSESDRLEVKLIDFGFARIMHSSLGTRLSRFVGALLYSAPEVFERRASSLSDVYSLGVTTFELITGSPPFNSKQIDAMIYKQVELRPPPARQPNVEIPERVNDLLRRTVSKHVKARPKSARKFYVELREALRIM